MGHWSPVTTSSPDFNFSLTLKEINASVMLSQESNILLISPVQVHWAKKGAGAFVTETTVEFDISSNWRIEHLTFWSDPLQYCTLEAFSVVTPGTRHSFLNLQDLSTIWSNWVPCKELTNSATIATSSSEPVVRRSWRPGIMSNNAWHIFCSHCSLKNTWVGK